MSLLSVAQDVCQVVGVERVTTVFGNINNQRTQQELLTHANECAQRLARDTRDWSALVKTATVTGDGVTESFALPSDFLRLLLDSNVWTSRSTFIPLVYVNSYDEWLRRKASGFWDSRGAYILIGGRIYINPILAAGATATFAYLSNLIITVAATGLTSPQFISDDDTFLLDERLLKLMLIWVWKEAKGSPYAEAMGTYSDALWSVAGRDQPAPILIAGRPSSGAYPVTAYPWPLPTP
jgi:hypothetical protein